LQPHKARPNNIPQSSASESGASWAIVSYLMSEVEANHVKPFSHTIYFQELFLKKAIPRTDLSSCHIRHHPTQITSTQPNLPQILIHHIFKTSRLQDF